MSSPEERAAESGEIRRDAAFASPCGQAEFRIPSEQTAGAFRRDQAFLFRDIEDTGVGTVYREERGVRGRVDVNRHGTVRRRVPGG